MLVEVQIYMNCEIGKGKKKQLALLYTGSAGTIMALPLLNFLDYAKLPVELHMFHWHLLFWKLNGFVKIIFASFKAKFFTFSSSSMEAI